MKPCLASLFTDIPQQLSVELCQTLLEKPNVRIDRILSRGHQSPNAYWYDQKQDEWVLLLQGRARLSFVDTPPVEMNPGDYLFLPAHCKHRVEWTSPDVTTIWLAIHIFADED